MNVPGLRPWRDGPVEHELHSMFPPIAVTNVLCGVHTTRLTAGGVGGVGGVETTPRGHAPHLMCCAGLGEVVSDPLLEAATQHRSARFSAVFTRTIGGVVFHPLLEAAAPQSAA